MTSLSSASHNGSISSSSARFVFRRHVTRVVPIWLLAKQCVQSFLDRLRVLKENVCLSPSSKRSVSTRNGLCTHLDRPCEHHTGLPRSFDPSVLTTLFPSRMPPFDVYTTHKCPGDSSITPDTYIPDTKAEQLKWLDIALRAQGLRGQQALITLDELIACAHDKILDEPDLALTDLLTRRYALRKEFAGQARHLTKSIPYEIWSLVFRLVLDLVRAVAHVDLLTQPATFLRPTLDFAAVTQSWRRDILGDAALWSFLPVHLGCILRGDPYELSQIKVYLDRIGDRIPAHLCVRGWTDDDEGCSAALLKALPFLPIARRSVPEPNIKELTVIGMIDGNGTGTLKHLPAVFLPFVPALSGLSVLNSSSGIMHSLSLPGFPDPTNLRMLNIDLRGTEDWQDDWHFPALFKAIGSSIQSFRLRTNGTPTSPTSDRRPPTQTDIFISLNDLDICLDDIGGCLTGLLLGYHQFIGLQKLTLVTHGHWADMGFTWAQAELANWLKPKWLTIVAWALQSTDPRERTGFEWVSSAIREMDSVETLELRGVRGVNSHVQPFLRGIHMRTSTGSTNTRFRNLKRLVLCEVSFDATALAEFVETQRSSANSMGGYAYYIEVVFQGECEGPKVLFERQRPQGLTHQMSTTISNELPVFVGGVNIPIRFLAEGDHSD